MAEESSGERTESPSAKRRSDFRKKGQVAQSREVQTAAMFTLLLLFWIAFAPTFWGSLQELVASIPTKLPLMAEMLVPVSFALVTDFDDEFLGLLTEEEMVKLHEQEAKWAAASDPFAPAGGPAGSACGSCGEQAGSPACASCSGGTSWVLPGPDGATSGKDD